MINAHQFFTEKLGQSEAVRTAVSGNIFKYPCDEELDENPPKPYIVVANRGTQNAKLSKDEGMEGDLDNTNVDIIVCGESDAQVCEVAQLARDAIKDAMNHFGEEEQAHYGWWLSDSNYSDSGIAFNEYTLNRSCVLTYRIETIKQ